MSTPAASPYAAPTANVDDIASNPEAEAIRKAHISREASIKSIGILYYLGGAALAFTGIFALFARNEMGWMMVLGLPLGAGQIAVGAGLRTLHKWAQIASCAISGLGLLAFPTGTLINAYILYLLLSKKGRFVFTPEYKDIIAATPEVKYRTSIIVWIFVALLVLLVAAAFLVPMFAKR